MKAAPARPEPRDARPAAPVAPVRLVGVQAQAANAPYLGLWTRLDGFELNDLADRLHDRTVVRGSVLRGAQHLVRAADYGWLRPLIAPALDRARQAAWGRVLAGGSESAMLSVDLFEQLSPAYRDAVEAEATRLLDFATSGLRGGGTGVVVRG